MDKIIQANEKNHNLQPNTTKCKIKIQTELTNNGFQISIPTTDPAYRGANKALKRP